MNLVTITDEETLRYFGWGAGGKPVPASVSAAPKLWLQWRQRVIKGK